MTGHREYLDENLGKPWVLRMLLAEFSSVLYGGLGNCSDEELHVRMTDNPSTRYATAVIDGINRDGSEVFGATREVGVDLQKLVTQAGMTVNSSKQRK